MTLLTSFTPPKYESTYNPTGPRNYAGNEPGAAATLGKRDEAGLQAAFIGGVGTTSTDQENALVNARNIMNRLALQNPSEGLTADTAEQNEMFPQYRRNFIPVGDSAAEYTDVRDKNSVTTGVGTGLGTAYSPTIASPGVGEGVNPTNLRSVPGEATLILKEAASAAGPNPLYNPSNVAHTNRSSEGLVTDVGGVRRFKLGIASSTQTSLEVNSNRGQFPNQPVVGR